MEDKLRYALSVRTLIEMTLLRASRIATVASIEELMRAVRALAAGGGAAKMAAVPVSSATKPAARPQLTPEEQRKMMDDPKLNALLAALPGAKVTAIK